MAEDLKSVINQHLIDPETCIQCNTCESTCPEKAISHTDRNYVVDVDKCTSCMACISPCPTGAIDHWRMVPRAKAYSVQEQLGWSSLPLELTANELAAEGVTLEEPTIAAVDTPLPSANTTTPKLNASQFSATLPPWSAAHPYTKLYNESNPVTATVTGNMRVTEVDLEYDTHHIVLDLGKTPFPVLEGQSIGIIPPGLDASGNLHHARLYSISSPRNGEREGYNNLALTIKRVSTDRQGNPVHGVASNYLCDLKVGDSVQVIGPFGTTS